MDLIADRFMADLQKDLSKTFARRAEILTHAEFEHLKDPGKTEILTYAEFEHLKDPRMAKIKDLEGRMAVYLKRKVDALKLDGDGKAFVELKLEQKLGFHGPIWALATLYTNQYP